MLKNFSATIFLVDDDAMCLNLYQQFLKQLGYTNIRLFDNGTDCIESLNLQPQIVFLDYNMDEMNGIDVMKQIKQFNPAITVLIISGQEDIEIAVNAMRQGALDYIVKSSLNPDKMKKIMERIENESSSYDQKPDGQDKKSIIKRLFS